MLPKKSYKRRLGLLNEAMNPPVATTSDGRAWITQNGTILMFPDQWAEPNHSCYHPMLMTLPVGTDVVTTDGFETTT